MIIGDFMKNKKGFTLVEIIGVIAVLSVIMLVTVPSILRTLKKSENEKYEAFLQNLYLATENYIVQNSTMYPELKTVGGTTTVSIKVLREEKLVKKQVINPKTNENILDTQGIKVTVQNDKTNQYSFENGIDFYTINNYVSSDLYVQYDGIKNESRTKPHSTSMRTWNNVAPNAKTPNGTMTGFNAGSGWTTDNGLLFDGVDDYIDTGFKEATFAQDFTISTIVTIAEIKKYRGLWGPHRGSPENAGLHAQSFEDGSAISFGYWWGTGANATSISADKLLQKKVQITNVYQGGKELKTYLNGVFIGKVPLGGVLNPVVENNFWVGKTFPDIDRYFKGKMYNFMIYNRDLTEEEVKQNYNVDKVRYSL